MLLRHFYLSFLLLFMLASIASAQSNEWRLRIKEAAIANDTAVTLGDIAEPYGAISTAEWNKLSKIKLWPAPPEEGKPLQINKVRLNQVLKQRLGTIADKCILPSSLAIQYKGSVLYENDIRNLVVKTLTPNLNAMDGQAEIKDFRLPAYIFIAHSGQTVELEPVKLKAGRINLRFAIKELDASLVKKFTGSAFINLWKEIASAATGINKGETIQPDNITFMRKNLAYIRGEPWDGRGGPWQVIRQIGAGETIFLNDIEPMAMIKKGSIVNLIYQKNNLKLTLKAEAMEDGSAGETIQVRNLQSKKQVYGTVQDPNTVIVR